MNINIDNHLYNEVKIMNIDYPNLFKALSDDNRLSIIKLLVKGETCGCTLIDKLPITQPTLSYHLRILTEAGITIAYKEGTWVKHYVDHDKLDLMINFLIDLKKSEKSCNL